MVCKCATFCLTSNLSPAHACRPSSRLPVRGAPCCLDLVVGAGILQAAKAWRRRRRRGLGRIAASTCACCSLESTKRWITLWHVSVWVGGGSVCVLREQSKAVCLMCCCLLHPLPPSSRSFLALPTPPPPRPAPHLAGILALPADHEGDLAAAFAGLWQYPDTGLPPLMQAGVMESSAGAVLRLGVLVYDAASMAPGVLAAAQSKVQQLQQGGGAAALGGGSCQLLTINSNGSGGGAPIPPGTWGNFLHCCCMPGGGAGEPAQRPPVPAAGLGAWLGDSDVAGLRVFVHDWAVRGVIPHLEARLRALNLQVGCGRGREGGRARRVRG